MKLLPDLIDEAPSTKESVYLKSFLNMINDDTHSAKLRPKDVLRRSPEYFLWAAPYDSLCNAKRSPPPTSWGRPLLTYSELLNMTS